MSVTASDFLASSHLMLANSSEIDLRNAISRAYYGVYHSAMESARRLSLPEYATGSAHERLAARFKDSGHKSIAYRISDNHKKRCIADYEVSDDVTLDQALVIVASMDKLIIDLGAL